jgi:hypothetical protein
MDGAAYPVPDRALPAAASAADTFSPAVLLRYPLSDACVGQSLVRIRGSARDGVGSEDTDGSAGAAKLNAPVKSPVTDLRQALKFGTSGPKRVSRNRSKESSRA